MTAEAGEGFAENSLRFVTRIGTASAALWAAAILAALRYGPGAAAGIAIGGALTLASFALHVVLARHWLGQARPSGRLYLWALWLIKWPTVGALLYFPVTSGLAPSFWLCVGAAIIPTTAIIFALPALLLAVTRRQAAGGAG